MTETLLWYTEIVQFFRLVSSIFALDVHRLYTRIILFCDKKAESISNLTILTRLEEILT